MDRKGGFSMKLKLLCLLACLFLLPCPAARASQGDCILTDQDGRYLFRDGYLVQAEYGPLSCTLQDDGYLISDGASSFLWNAEPLSLDAFNGRLMPRSAEEAAHLNRFYEVILDLISPGIPPEGVSDSPGGTAIDLGWHMYPVAAARDTTFTNDPREPLQASGRIEEGKSMVLLSRWDSLYAYVAFAREGQPTRGFIPLRDLTLQAYSTRLAAAQLQGSYRCICGGNTLSDAITFRYDGTFTQADGQTGSWRITGDYPFTLTLDYTKDASESMTILLRSEGFSLFSKGTGAGDYRQE